MARSALGDLRIAVTYVENSLAGGLAIPDANTDAAAAGLALLRAMLLHAQALLSLGTSNHADAGTSNLRSLFEAWVQLMYLLAAPDPNNEGRRYTIFALLEFLAYMHDREFDPDDIAAVVSSVEPFRRLHPALLRSVEQQRAGKEPGRSPRYWTGMKPTALVKHVSTKLGDGVELSTFYKYAFWDAHHVLTPALAIARIEVPEGVRLEIRPRQPPAEVADLNAHLASRMIGKAWSTLTDTLGLTRLSNRDDG